MEWGTRSYGLASPRGSIEQYTSCCFRCGRAVVRLFHGITRRESRSGRTTGRWGVRCFESFTRLVPSGLHTTRSCMGQPNRGRTDTGHVATGKGCRESTR
eukprot:3871233-Alexandrium_andersonii.AAC.1